MQHFSTNYIYLSYVEIKLVLCAVFEGLIPSLNHTMEIKEFMTLLDMRMFPNLNLNSGLLSGEIET